jgi:hypothetical protein
MRRVSRHDVTELDVKISSAVGLDHVSRTERLELGAQLFESQE